jgi:hypothetical protein
MNHPHATAYRPGSDTAVPDEAAISEGRTKKVAAILAVMLQGVTLNRFEAEGYHDHCLHSTVSTLQNGYGIKIDRVTEVVPCLRGQRKTRCRRYWLLKTPENLDAARALLAHWSGK